MRLSEIKKAKLEGKTMVWNDPDPIDGNDYTITYMEDLSKYDEFDDEEFDECSMIILIQYGEGSEAEVLSSEIELV